MAEIKGVDVLIKIGSQVIGGQRNATVEMSAETLDTTTKSSGGWSTKIAGLKSWTCSADGVFFIDDAGHKACETAFLAGNAVQVELSNTSGLYYAGDVIITSMSVEAGQDDVVSYSVSFEGTGELTTTEE